MTGEKGLIGSKLKGPGPGRYGLPSTCGQTAHDITQHMKPSYSFGKHLGLSFIKKVTLGDLLVGFRQRLFSTKI